MTFSAFVRSAALSFLNERYLVPDNESIARLEILLSKSHDAIETIANKKKDSILPLNRDYTTLKKKVSEMETELTKTLRNPQRLQTAIKSAIENDPQFRLYLFTILEPYR